MKKRLLAGAMAVASIAALLAGCGGSGSSQAAGDATANTASAEGQVINIYSWNDEFRTRLEAVYPEVDHTSDDGTVTYLKDGTEIHWVINPNQDGVYQQKLDEALLNQATAAADDKIDIFLSETDYVYKYTDADADVAMPLTDLGIDPDTDLADQYPFTKTTASDQNGVQRGSTWQCCPGLLVYRRDIAKDVFGTDDPAVIGEKVKDWDTLKQTAEELKAKGYFTFASYADTFRVYGNNVSQPWVTAGETTVKVDPLIMDWIESSKEWLDAGYLESRRALIGRSALEPMPGSPDCGGTVYFCTADRDGNMVSWIQSNYNGFGSGVVVPGTGIALHNRGCNFSLDPASPNCLAPGKRSYHTIIPGFLTKDGRAVGPFGVMGAFMQPQGHVQALINMLDLGMNPQEALDAPRWEGPVWDACAGRGGKLTRTGHDITIPVNSLEFGRGQIIWRDDAGTLCGATEPRADGGIAAY